MIEQLSRFFSVLSEVRDKCWKALLGVFMIMVAVGFPLTLLIQNMMAKLAGTGWGGETPRLIWDRMFGSIVKGGLPIINEIGESVVFFKAMYSGIQMLLVISIQIILAGFASWVIIQILKNKNTSRDAIYSSFRPAIRYLGGMWLTIFPLFIASLIGSVVQVFISTPDFVSTHSGFTPWSIGASAIVILLVFMFLRITFLGLVRLESSERFFDSIKYAIHISSGKIVLISIIVIPVVLFSMFITYFTDAIPLVKNITVQFGILLVVIVETSLYISLTEKQEKPGEDKSRELLG